MLNTEHSCHNTLLIDGLVVQEWWLGLPSVVACLQETVNKQGD